MKNKIHEHKNTERKIDVKELYELDKLSLDDNDKYDISVRLKEDTKKYMT